MTLYILDIQNNTPPNGSLCSTYTFPLPSAAVGNMNWLLALCIFRSSKLLCVDVVSITKINEIDRRSDLLSNLFSF